MHASCLITAGQKQVENYPKDELTLQRIEQLTELQSAEIITENVQILEPLPLTGHTHEDSLNLQYLVN